MLALGGVLACGCLGTTFARLWEFVGSSNKNNPTLYAPLAPPISLVPLPPDSSPPYPPFPPFGRSLPSMPPPLFPPSGCQSAETAEGVKDYDEEEEEEEYEGEGEEEEEVEEE